MKFTLRNVFLAVFVLSVIAAVISTQTNSRRQDYATVMRMPHVAGTAYFATSCIAINEMPNPHQVTGTHIIRIQNHSDFEIEMGSYNPATKQTRLQKCDIENAITSINYESAGPDELGPSFWVNNIIHPANPADHVFWISVPENCCFWPYLNQPPAPVNSEPFLVYFFSDDALTIEDMPQKWGPELMSSTSLVKIETKCSELGIQCVYFRLLHKNAG